jgi:hypothetical protein
MGGEPDHDEGNTFSNDTKRKCMYFLYCVSTLSVIMGLCACAYAFISFGGSVDVAGTNSEDYTSALNIDANAAIGYLAGVSGILALLVGILGCCAAYCRNCCTSVTFCLMALIIGFLCLAAGGLVMFADWEEIQTQACETVQEDFTLGSVQVTGTEYMQAQYGAMVDDFMCSAACPCDNAIVDSTYLDGIADLAGYGDIGRQTSANVAVDTTLIPIDVSGTGDGFYSTYTECYDAVVSTQTDQADNEEFVEFVTNGGFDFLAAIEEEFDCAGICYVPLFPMTQAAIAENVPVTQGCVQAFIERG